MHTLQHWQRLQSGNCWCMYCACIRWYTERGKYSVQGRLCTLAAGIGTSLGRRRSEEPATLVQCWDQASCRKAGWRTPWLWVRWAASTVMGFSSTNSMTHPHPDMFSASQASQATIFSIKIFKFPLAACQLRYRRCHISGGTFRIVFSFLFAGRPHHLESCCKSGRAWQRKLSASCEAWIFFYQALSITLDSIQRTEVWVGTKIFPDT